MDDIRDWLRAKLDGAPRGTKVRLARALGLAPDAVTRMLNSEAGKETRKITAEEHIKMRAFFAEDAGEPIDPQSLARENAMMVFDNLPPDLQAAFAKQLDALADLARARLSQAPPHPTDQD
jgi:hypothetical protein